MANPKATVQEGTLPFTYEGETFQTYYKVFGDLKNSTKTPFVVLHGGPGLIHKYLLPYSDLSVDYDIPVILYDQIGNGQSTHLREKPPTFWTLELFIHELENLLNYFGIADSFDLAGHSWGGILGAEFVVRRQPKGLKHFVLLDSLPSFALWIQSVMQLLQAFPEDVAEAMKVGMKEPKRYYEALKKFHARHGCILVPPPKEYIETLDAVFLEGGDATVASAP